MVHTRTHGFGALEGVRDTDMWVIAVTGRGLNMALVGVGGAQARRDDREYCSARTRYRLGQRSFRNSEAGWTPVTRRWSRARVDGT